MQPVDHSNINEAAVFILIIINVIALSLILNMELVGNCTESLIKAKRLKPIKFYTFNYLLRGFYACSRLALFILQLFQ